jgi:hypothetical protein
MAKNIIVCSDGTGNSAIKGRGTNVFKIFESIDLNRQRFDPKLAPQIAIYDDGVGTDDFKPLKLLGGATGWGLSRNVKQLYKELCRVYDPGDRIFLFGFSRGAFTVRTLAGLICACGIIDTRAPEQSSASALEQTVREAYRAYRKRYRTALMELFLGKPDRDPTAEFRKKCCHGTNTPIAFIGVWDTVDAVGLPFHISDVINATVYRFKFPDRKLSDKVERAYHALAIDDERHSFHPLLWDETERRAHTEQVLEQVWFAGAHSNVGGGYPKQGMSLVALDWMMQKASDAGLRFVPGDRGFYADHANIDDKLYDPRAGLATFYRWKPRDVSAVCQENNVPPALHLSVLERIAHGTDDYAPGNLPPDAKVVITPTGHPGSDATAGQRATEVQAVLRTAHADGRPLLARVRTAIAMGRLSYYVYLVACIAVIVAAAAGPAEGLSMIHLWPFLKNAGLLIYGLVTSPIDTAIKVFWGLVSNRTLLIFLALGFVASYVLGLLADQRMNAVFSQFWHKQQQRLRDALKRARRIAAGEEADPKRSPPVDAGTGTRRSGAAFSDGAPQPGG